MTCWSAKDQTVKGVVCQEPTFACPRTQPGSAPECKLLKTYKLWVGPEGELRDSGAAEVTPGQHGVQLWLQCLTASTKGFHNCTQALGRLPSLQLLLLVALYELAAQRPPAAQVVANQAQPLALRIKVTNGLLRTVTSSSGNSRPSASRHIALHTNKQRHHWRPTCGLGHCTHICIPQRA